ncbi:MAG: UDP-N-acetylmuramoyl-L-alanine--D-glutamate ligase [Tindallia sp. MSAO_Bac2]|nr:MAG: UDP-N-acetylmuramoyl-L-alanine--D-glutamate ligase [Tindallia sp. MSAO_Bac2]
MVFNNLMKGTDKMNINKEMLNGKKVLIVGLGITGISLARFLHEQNSLIIINDAQNEDNLGLRISQLKNIPYTGIFGKHPNNLEEAGNPELIALSPGVPLDLPLIKDAISHKIPVLGEIELAYHFIEAPIAAITGTNGKTTTTALLGDMVERAGINNEVVGNIGTATVSKIKNLTKDSFCIMEISSFQLETIIDFKPKVAAVLNITADHLNRHKSMEKYAELKFKIFSNQKSGDVAVINADDSACQQYLEQNQNPNHEVMLFSSKKMLDKGIFIKDGKVIVKDDLRSAIIIDRDKILIPGNHNLENAMAAVGLAWCMDVPLEAIRESLEEFKGVEHRIETVEVIDGVVFINDSKATNPDAAEKAVLSVKEPIILLAGGMDKGNDFTELIKLFKNRVKQLIVYGETADKLAYACAEEGFYHVTKTADLEQAFKIACQEADAGDTVLLSPACASWDMYESYEVRGNHFKKLVKRLKRK